LAVDVEKEAPVDKPFLEYFRVLNEHLFENVPLDFNLNAVAFEDALDLIVLNDFHILFRPAARELYVGHQPQIWVPITLSSLSHLIKQEQS